MHVDEVGEPCSRRRPRHEEGILARPHARRAEDCRGVRAVIPGEEGQIGLVLDLLQPSQGDRGSGVPVEDGTEALRQELRIAIVTTVNRDGDRPCLVKAAVPRHAPLLRAVGLDAVRVDAHVPEEARHVVR